MAANFEIKNKQIFLSKIERLKFRQYKFRKHQKIVAI